jgi:hypothetical protein
LDAELINPFDISRNLGSDLTFINGASVVTGVVGSLCSHDGRGGGVTEGYSAPLSSFR